MLSAEKVNPLNVLKCKEVDTLPPYFTYLHLDIKPHSSQASLIRHWIYENLKNRFCMTEQVVLKDKEISFTTQIGFEEAKEYMFFLLACPHLK
jgi:hypothetical protein